MTVKYAYPATIEDDGSGMYLVTFTDLPEALTDGATVEEAIANATDALEEAIASRIEDKEEIPSPSEAGKDQIVISLSVLSAAKAAFYEAMQTQSLSYVEFARRINQSEAAVRRLINPRHKTKIATLTEALSELGMEMEVSFVPKPESNSHRDQAAH